MVEKPEVDNKSVSADEVPYYLSNPEINKKIVRVIDKVKKDRNKSDADGV